MLWSKLNDYDKKRNTKFKLKESIHGVDGQFYKRKVGQICETCGEKIMDEDWKSAGLDESSVKQFINLAPGDDWGMDEEEDIGCVPLLE